MRKSFARHGQKRWPIYSLTGSGLNKPLGILFTLVLIFKSGVLPAQPPLSVEEAIRLSGEHSFNVAAARSDSMGAYYDLSAAQTLRYPTATLAASSYYINKLQSVNLPFESLTLGIHYNYQADFRLSLPLWTGGRIGGQIDVQSALANARGGNLGAVRLANAYNTRQAFLRLLAANALARASDASLARVKLIGEDAQSRYTNGIADSVDLLETDLALQRAIQAQDEKATASGNARAFLGHLVGLPPDSVIIVDSIPIPDIQIYQNQHPTKEIIDRPELRVQESRIRAANFTVSLSKANYFPTLNGFGGYSVGKPNKDMFQNKWNDYWTAGLNLNWDFNIGNKTGKTISSARQAANSAKAMKADLEDTFLLQANTAYDNLHLAWRSYGISQKQFEIAQKEYALGKQQQQAGNLSLYRLLELEADLTSSEQMFRVSTINYYIAETEYLYAIGSPRIYGGLIQ
jgi:outer membrane protein